MRPTRTRQYPAPIDYKALATQNAIQWAWSAIRGPMSLLDTSDDRADVLLAVIGDMIGSVPSALGFQGPDNTRAETHVRIAAALLAARLLNAKIREGAAPRVGYGDVATLWSRCLEDAGRVGP